MAETLKSVRQLHDEHGPTDATATFNRLWEILGECKAKVDQRFPTEIDPSTEPFWTYGGPTGPRGELRAFVGEDVDWMVHSWLGDPETGFTNMHLTVWLGPHLKAPHLGMAWGTLPNLWCYIDYQARSDLMIDLDHLDRYFQPFNDQFLELRENEALSPFVSRALYVRQSVSNVANCFLADTTDENIEFIGELAHRQVDAWLAHLEDPELVPEDQREAMAERDLAVRRNVAERDPANEMGVRYFGQETTDALVGALWGADRQLPRPGVS